jgi:hypothetical protein
MKKGIRIGSLLFAVILSLTGMANADEVTDWNQIMIDALRVSGLPVGGNIRGAAIVQASVFDALNGIEQRYTPIHVQPAAAPGASRRAAVVQAAYASLLGVLTNLTPAQMSDLNAKYAASLSAIASSEAVGKSQSIDRGIEWGQRVADAILLWRSTDGFVPAPPSFFGIDAPGQWRSTPPAFAPFAGLQFATMPPFLINSPTQFPVPVPPALTSAQYTVDFNEVKLLGAILSPSRTADQTLAALFWQSTSGPYYIWDTVAVSLSKQRNLTLSENARLLALVNVAIIDAFIAAWNGKRTHNFWRPITAIQLADTDGNPATIPDPAWTPLLVTPPYPDQPSGLNSVSAAAATVLADFFGTNTAITVQTDSTVPGLAGVTRSFPDFASALDEVVEARIWGGIHFRYADVDGRRMGTSVASYILENALTPVHGKHTGQSK